MKQKIFIVDAYGFLFRAYYSLPSLEFKNESVGAIYGFIKMILSIISTQNISNLVLVCDSGKVSFRHEIYPDYKKNRPASDNELKRQFPIIQEFAKAFNILCLERIGYEADDVIASLAKKITANSGYEVVVVSSDKDLMQLVNDESGISMFDPLKKISIDEQYVREKFNIKSPKVLGDLMSLTGDNADNIPGAPGIGKKTAEKLIEQFGNLNNLLSNTHEIKNIKQKNIIELNTENIALAKRLILLREDIAIDINEESFDFKKSLDSTIISKFIAEYGFESMVNQLEKILNINIDITINREIQRFNFTSITPDSINDFYSFISKGTKQFIYINKAKCILLISDEKISNIYYLDYSVAEQLFISIFNFLDNASSHKVFNNAIEVKRECIKLGYNYTSKNFDDIALISYLIKSDSEGKLWKDIFYKDNNTVFLPNENNDLRYNALLTHGQDLCIQIAVYPKLLSMISGELLYIYEAIDKKMIDIIINMESIGINIDVQMLHNIQLYIEDRQERLARDIYGLAGKKFNIASTQQVSDVLFNDLKITPPTGYKKKTKSGFLSVDNDILEALNDKGNVIAGLLINWRSFAKINSTYIQGIINHLDSNNKIHTNFSLIKVNTGRLSSSNPNLQNLPIKDNFAKKIRQSFIPEKGKLFISADYSQIELRIIAYIANVQNMIAAFNQNIDIHTLTASTIFNTPMETVDEQMRYKAKAVNFGIIYGISPFGLSRQLKIDRAAAGNYINSYLNSYPEIKDYMNSAIEIARKDGYVKTIAGRICCIKNILSSNYVERMNAERSAINAPIQGTAADIMKLAMINLNNCMSSIKDANMVLQIHDEIIIECLQEDLAMIKPIIEKNMLPLEVSGKIPLKINLKVSSDNLLFDNLII